MIRITISVSVLIVLILLIRKRFYYKITRKIQYTLWLIIPLYLLLVPFVHIKLPVYYNFNLPLIKEQQKIDIKQYKTKTGIFIGKHKKIQDKTDQYVFMQNDKLQNGKNSLQIEKSNPENKTNVFCYIISIVKFLYYIVLVIVIVFMLVKNIKFILFCTKNRIYYKTDFDTGIIVYILEDATVPFLLGKCVYISRENTENQQYLKYMILHEYCHWKQGDVFWGIVKCLVKAFFWYNPLVWIASGYEEYDCELACDEAVIKISGKENIQQYGDVLLYLALKQTVKYYKNIIITSMGGEMRMLKERILYIISEKKNKKIAAIATVLITGIFLTGLFISFPDKPQAMEKDKSLYSESKISKEDDINKEKDFLENNYYNYMKSYGDYIYFPWSNSLYRTDIKTNKNEKISDGFFRLGDIMDGYLYYTKIELGDLKKTENGVVIIGRMLLEDLSEETIYKEKSENFWGFSQPYVTEDGTVYVEEGMGTIQKCHTYKYDGNINKWEEESNNTYICNVLEKSQKEHYLYNDYIYLCSNYVKSVLEKEKFFFVNPSSSSMLINDINGKTLKKIDNYKCNLLIAYKGFLYTDERYNIHLCNYDEPFNDKIIFKPGEKISYINYGVYDKNGIYGYYNNKNKETVIIRLS